MPAQLPQPAPDDPLSHLRCRGCNKVVKGSLARHLGKKPICRKMYDLNTPRDGDVPSELEETIEAGLRKRQCRVLFDVSKMRNEDLCPAASLDRMKESNDMWVSLATHGVSDEIASTMGGQVALKIESVIHKHFNFYKGMHTQAQEESLLGKVIPLLEPVHYMIGDNSKDRIDGIDLLQWFQLLVRHDEVARNLIVGRSESWKRGECEGDCPDIISDFDDAGLFRKGRLAKRATAAQKNDLRVYAIVGMDGVELLGRALGDKRGNHNTEMVYLSIGPLALLPSPPPPTHTHTPTLPLSRHRTLLHIRTGNLPLPMRFDHDYIAPCSIMNSNMLKRLGYVRGMSGIG